MDRDDVHARLTHAAEATGLLSGRARKLVDKLAGEIAGDPRNPDEPERFYRTVLVVEVIAANAPYEEDLEYLSGEIVAERVLARVVTQSTMEVGPVCTGTGSVGQPVRPHAFFFDSDVIVHGAWPDYACKRAPGDPIHTAWEGP